MARELYVVGLKFSKSVVFYDGIKSDKHRREFSSLDSLIDNLPEVVGNVKKQRKVNIHFEGFDKEQISFLKNSFGEYLSKANYSIVKN